MSSRSSGSEEAKDSGSSHEREEISVIASSNAIIQPHTVVVVGFYTIVADAAVVPARGAPEVAGAAVFCGDFHGGYGVGFTEGAD